MVLNPSHEPLALCLLLETLMTLEIPVDLTQLSIPRLCLTIQLQVL